MKEEFRSISGYAGAYAVSNLGRVVNAKNRNERTPYMVNGHPYVKLCKNGKYKAHQVCKLVANEFLGTPGFKAKIEHVDGDKTNNNLLNLRWKATAADGKRVVGSDSIKHSCATEWCIPICGYVGLYKVSNCGRVFNAQTGEQIPINEKYSRNYNRPYVDLKKGNEVETVSVAKLVAREFLDEYRMTKKPTIYYINGNMWDCRVKNLTVRKPQGFFSPEVIEEETDFEKELHDIEEEECEESTSNHTYDIFDPNFSMTDILNSMDAKQEGDSQTDIINMAERLSSRF